MHGYVHCQPIGDEDEQYAQAIGLLVMQEVLEEKSRVTGSSCRIQNRVFIVQVLL
jgi:hypothetical protein